MDNRRNIAHTKKHHIVNNYRTRGLIASLMLIVLPASANDVFYMAEAIYHEARDQEHNGQIAVGCVIKNRVDSKRWRDTVEGVVHQRKQFSYYSDGKPEVFDDVEALRIAITLSGIVLSTNICETSFDDMDHYINHEIANPKALWYTDMKKIVVIGDHTFYKENR